MTCMCYLYALSAQPQPTPDVGKPSEPAFHVLDMDRKCDFSCLQLFGTQEMFVFVVVL